MNKKTRRRKTRTKLRKKRYSSRRRRTSSRKKRYTSRRRRKRYASRKRRASSRKKQKGGGVFSSIGTKLMDLTPWGEKIALPGNTLPVDYLPMAKYINFGPKNPKKMIGSGDTPWKKGAPDYSEQAKTTKINNERFNKLIEGDESGGGMKELFQK